MRLSPSIALAFGFLAGSAAAAQRVQAPEAAAHFAPALPPVRLFLPQSALSFPQLSLSLERDTFLVNPKPASAIAALEAQAYPLLAEAPRTAASARLILAALAQPEVLAAGRGDLAGRIGEDNLAVLEGAAEHLRRIAHSDEDLRSALERIKKKTATEGYGLQESLEHWEGVFDIKQAKPLEPGTATLDASEQYWEKRVQERLKPGVHGAFQGMYPPEIIAALEEELFVLNEERGGAPLRIADIGAWDAYVLRALLDSPILSSFLSRSRMIALDLDKPEGIENLLRGTPIEYRVGRAQELPFAAGSLDFVLTSYVLDYIDFKEWPKVLGEIRWVLTRGGRAAIIFHHPDSPYMKNWSGEAPTSRPETEADRAARLYLAKLERLVLGLGEPTSLGFSQRLQQLRETVRRRPVWPQPVMERHFRDGALVELLSGKAAASWPKLRDDTLEWIREEIKAHSMEAMMHRLRASLERFHTPESLSRYLAQQGFPVLVTVLEDGRHQPTGFLAVFSQP